jgi:HEAT repeat protein
MPALIPNWLRHVSVGLLAVVTMAVMVPSPALAQQRYAGDPVEALRQALKVRLVDPARNPDELRYRKKNLEEHIERLRGPGDMRRALVLQEWLDEDTDRLTANVDREVRTDLINRLVSTIGQILEHGDALARLAASTLVGEMGINVRAVGNRRGVASVFAPDLAKLVTKDPNLRVREAAARALGGINPDPKLAVPPLQQLLLSDEPALRQAAAFGLRDMIQQILVIVPAKGRTLTGIEASRPEVVQVAQTVVPAAGRGLSDSDADVRRLCIEAIQLGAVALSDLVQNPPANLSFPPPGRKVTEDEQAEMEGYRKEVQEEQAELHPLAQSLRDLAPAFARILRDPVAQNRVLGCRALEDMANARLRLLRRATSVPPAPSGGKAAAAESEGVRPVAGQEPAQARAEPLPAALRVALPALARALSDPDVNVRRAALDVLELLGPSGSPAGPAVLRATSDPDLFVRWAAARTFGKIGGAPVSAAIPALTRLLEEQDVDLQLAVAAVLERFGEPARGAVPALAQAAGRNDAEVRVGVLHALESVTDQDRASAAIAVPAITGQLTHPDPRVRRAAAEVLGQIGALAQSAEQPLRAALTDSDVEVRRAASDALLNILPAKALRGR